jgi:hypothetical protein
LSLNSPRDVVLKIQETLPQQLETVFLDILSPSILAVLRSNAVPTPDTEAGVTSQPALQSRVISQYPLPYADFKSDIQRIKDHLIDSKLTQDRIEACLNFNTSQKKIQDVDASHTAQAHPNRGGYEFERSLAGNNIHHSNSTKIPDNFPTVETDWESDKEESLRDVYELPDDVRNVADTIRYYVVLLQVGQFLRNLLYVFSASRYRLWILMRFKLGSFQVIMLYSQVLLLSH